MSRRMENGIIREGGKFRDYPVPPRQLVWHRFIGFSGYRVEEQSGIPIVVDPGRRAQYAL